MDMQELDAGLAGIMGESPMWNDDAVLLSLADGTEISLEYLANADELYLHSLIAPLTDGAGDTAMRLLKADLFAHDTGGSAVLAVTADGEAVILWEKMRLESVNFESFMERFAVFHLATLYWKDNLGGGGVSPKPGSDAVQPGFDMGVRV